MKAIVNFFVIVVKKRVLKVEGDGSVDKVHF